LKHFAPVFISQVLLCGSVFAQTPPPAISKDTVIATLDGQKLTYGELESYLEALGPQMKAAALSSRHDLIRQYALQKKIVELAEKDKLDQMSPYKEALELSRRVVLIEGEINYKALHFLVTPEDQKKYYDTHKARYTEVKLQALYLGFTSDEVAKENPKKYRNEAQAKALAANIRSEVKTQADFVKAVARYSEDETSKENKGEFGVVHASDTVPSEDVKKIIFAMKAGDISDPIKQQNGFYLFRADTVGLRPYAEVKDEIYTELKNQLSREWMDGLQKNLNIKEENAQFFNAPASSKK